MFKDLCVKFLPDGSDYVSCPDIYSEYISKDHYFKYDETTTYRDLCSAIACESKFKGNSISGTRIHGKMIFEYLMEEGGEIENELHIFHDGDIYEVANKDVKMSEIVEAFGRVPELILIWQLQWGGGKGVGGKEGVKFSIRPNEGSHIHLPHVHAKYSGEEIRIGLNPVVLLDDSSFRSPAKTKLALTYVERHQERLMKEWYLTANLGLNKVDLPTAI